MGEGFVDDGIFFLSFLFWEVVRQTPLQSPLYLHYILIIKNFFFDTYFGFVHLARPMTTTIKSTATATSAAGHIKKRSDKMGSEQRKKQGQRSKKRTKNKRARKK